MFNLRADCHDLELQVAAGSVLTAPKLWFLHSLGNKYFPFCKLFCCQNPNYKEYVKNVREKEACWVRETLMVFVQTNAGRCRLYQEG